MTISASQARWLDEHVVDVVAWNGQPVGPLRHIVTDPGNGRPSWASVDAGWGGLWQTLVPLDGSALTPVGLQVAFDASAVTDAPQVDDGDVLETEDEDALHDYYGPLARPLSRGDGPLTSV